MSVTVLAISFFLTLSIPKIDNLGKWRYLNIFKYVYFIL